jgi:hypothetical protein
MRAADHHPRKLEEAPLLLSETVLAFLLGLSVSSFRRNRGALHDAGMPQPLASFGGARPRLFWSRPAVQAWLEQDARAAGAPSPCASNVDDGAMHASAAILAKRAAELF